MARQNRPTPPSHLPDEQVSIWEAVVDSVGEDGSAPMPEDEAQKKEYQVLASLGGAAINEETNTITPVHEEVEAGMSPDEVSAAKKHKFAD